METFWNLGQIWNAKNYNETKWKGRFWINSFVYGFMKEFNDKKSPYQMAVKHAVRM